MSATILDARDRGVSKIEKILSFIVYIFGGDIDNRPANTKMFSENYKY